MNFVDFKVIAKRRAVTRVSRGGIARNKGGEVVSVASYRFPHTPYYLAVEIERDNHPDCEISVQA